MPRARRHIPLNVFLNSRHVGRLNRQASGAIDFQYERTWLDWIHALPISSNPRSADYPTDWICPTALRTNISA